MMNKTFDEMTAEERKRFMINPWKTFQVVAALGKNR